MATVDKVVLAYSGGLDTSVIVRWLQQTYDCEVVTFTADIGQGEEVEPAQGESAGTGGRADLYRRSARAFCAGLRFSHVPCEYGL